MQVWVSKVPGGSRLGELLRSATETFLALAVDAALGPDGSLWMDASHLEAAEAALRGADLGFDEGR